MIQRRSAAVRSLSTLVLLSSLACLPACSHVQLAPAGEPVRRLGAQEAPQCERIGTTRAQVLSKILFFDRSQTKMAEELTTLARNSAGDMGGNAVIAEGEIRDGKQTFGVYRCPED